MNIKLSSAVLNLMFSPRWEQRLSQSYNDALRKLSTLCKYFSYFKFNVKASFYLSNYLYLCVHFLFLI